MKRSFELTSNNDENEDVKAYLAMSSSDDEVNDENETNIKEGESTESSCADLNINKEGTTKDALEIYKNAIAEAEQKKNKKKRLPQREADGNMEMTFTSQDTREGQLSIDLKQKLENMAPWEKYLNKKKEKQKLKREARQLSRMKTNDSSDDTDIDIEIKKKKKNKRKEVKCEQPVSGDLSLLTMDSDDKEHFDYKEIVKKESKSSKKLKRALAKAKSEEQNFKVDLDDDRFSAVFQNADYNIDPSHPNFKKTQSMLDLVAEKQKRALKRHKKDKKVVSCLNTKNLNNVSLHKTADKTDSKSMGNQVKLHGTISL